jgi:hypothetical protein
MVAVIYALIFGMRPREIYEWYLAMYMDVLEWVESPNTPTGGSWPASLILPLAIYIQRTLLGLSHATRARHVEESMNGHASEKPRASR